MKNQHICELISSDLLKSISKEDKEKLRLWIEESELNKSVYKEVVDHWNSPLPINDSIINSDEVKNRIWDKVHKTDTGTTSRSNSHLILKILKYAAILIFFISIAAVVYQTNSSDNTDNVVTITKSNDAGRKSTIQLTDGTIINLNSESEITYNEVFSDTARVVRLSGEAYFDVAHNQHKPFYVITDEVEVEVIGTMFNMSSYPGSNEVKISLSNGKVKLRGKNLVSAGEQELVINPGYEISFLKDENKFSTFRMFDRLVVEGWRDGIIYFDKAKLQEIIVMLERWYGVEFSMTNEPRQDFMYSGTFDNQNLENVLTSIGFVVNFDFEIKERKVLLNFKE